MASNLTTIGKQKLASATPENQLEVTHIAVGDGNGSYPPVDNRTALENEVWRGACSAPIRGGIGKILIFEGFIPANIGGFTIREIGIFDSDGDLIGYAHTPLIEKPADGSENAITAAPRLHIALDDAADVDLIYNDAALLQHSGLAGRDAADSHPATAITTAALAALGLPQADVQTVLNALKSAALRQAGAANGVAELDSNGKVPLAQIPDSVLGQLEYQGLWNASTNTPTLSVTPPASTKGHYYIVSAAGTFDSKDFQVGDWIVSNGASWDKVDNTDAVSSVNGKTGNVVINAGDVGAYSQSESDARYWTQSQADVRFLRVANNLSDLANKATAWAELWQGRATTVTFENISVSGTVNRSGTDRLLFLNTGGVMGLEIKDICISDNIIADRSLVPSLGAYVKGNVNCNTLNTRTTSDRRLKTKVTRLPVDYDKLDKLYLATGFYNAMAGDLNGQQFIGGIAQDIRAVFPHCVSSQPHDTLGEYWAVDYPKLALAVALAELQRPLKYRIKRVLRQLWHSIWGQS